ncbi:HGGxSTG domain-containing protein [Dermabacteraceae bacterium P7006]
MRCKAKTRNGEQCKSHSVKGLAVCRMHGGSTPLAKRKRARFIAEEKAAKAARLFSAPVDISPSEALIELVQWTAGEVRYWRSEVERIAGEDVEKLTFGVTRIETGVRDGSDVHMETREAAASVAYQMLVDAENRLARFVTAALRAGVEERRLKLDEERGQTVVEILRKILDNLDLTDDQKAIAQVIVPKTLREAAAGME